jgi:hypothetical protein
MTSFHSAEAVSRRVALAGLGAGGLGLALAATARDAAAQDVATDMANHPFVGFWQLDPDPNSPTGHKIGLTLVHADGTTIHWGGLGDGVALGIWRPMGERTADSLGIFLDVDPSAKSDTPGTATFVTSITVDETGDRHTANGNLDARDDDGNLLVTLPAHWGASRVSFDRNPATGSTIPATPEAGTPTS